MTYTGEVAGDYFGRLVTGAGDANADGFADVLAGAHHHSGTGAFYIFFGSATPDNVADVQISGIGANDGFGQALARAGQLDGTGWPEIIVGAPANDAGGPDAGQVYIYTLGPPPLDVRTSTTPSQPGFLAPRPNPTRGVVRLGFELDRTAAISVVAMDLMGRKVAQAMESRPSGPGPVWHDWRPRGLAPGAYVLLARIGEREERRVLIWLDER